jgi:uncharacterized protein YjiS (DUF1127 family)
MQLESNAPDTGNQRGLLDLDKALVEAAGEMSFDWPESLPVERIKQGIAELALGSLLFAGVVALGSLFLLSFASWNNRFMNTTAFATDHHCRRPRHITTLLKASLLRNSKRKESIVLPPADREPMPISLLKILHRFRTDYRLAIERYRQRKQLMEMDDRQLKDIGITPEQAEQEARKPIWKE